MPPIKVLATPPHCVTKDCRRSVRYVFWPDEVDQPLGYCTPCRPKAARGIPANCEQRTCTTGGVRLVIATSSRTIGFLCDEHAAAYVAATS